MADEGEWQQDWVDGDEQHPWEEYAFDDDGYYPPVDNSWRGRTQRAWQEAADSLYARYVAYRVQRGLDDLRPREVVRSPPPRRRRQPPSNSAFVGVDPTSGVVVAKECCPTTWLQTAYRLTSFCVALLLLVTFALGTVARYDAWLVVRRVDSNMTLHGGSGSGSTAAVLATLRSDEPFYQLHMIGTAPRAPATVLLHGRCWTPPENITVPPRWRPRRQLSMAAGAHEAGSSSGTKEQAAGRSRRLSVDAADVTAASKFGASGGSDGWPVLVNPAAAPYSYLALQTCNQITADLPANTTVFPLTLLGTGIDAAGAAAAASLGSIVGLTFTCLSLAALWPLIPCGCLFGKTGSTWARQRKRAATAVLVGGRDRMRKGGPLQSSPPPAAMRTSVYGVAEEQQDAGGSASGEGKGSAGRRSNAAKPYVPTPLPGVQPMLPPGEGRDRPSVDADGGTAGSGDGVGSSASAGPAGAAAAAATHVARGRPCCWPCMVLHDDYPGMAWLGCAACMAASAAGYYSADHGYRDKMWEPLVAAAISMTGGSSGGRVVDGHIVVAMLSNATTAAAASDAAAASGWPLPGLEQPAGDGGMVWAPTAAYMRALGIMPGTGWGLTAVSYVLTLASLALLLSMALFGARWKFCRRDEGRDRAYRRRLKHVATLVDDASGRVLEIELPAVRIAGGDGSSGGGNSAAGTGAGTRSQTGRQLGQPQPAMAGEEHGRPEALTVNPIGRALRAQQAMQPA